MIEAFFVIVATCVVGLLGWMLRQNFTTNGYLQRMDERDKNQGLEILRLREKSHEHANTLQHHEGRITNLERSNYN